MFHATRKALVRSAFTVLAVLLVVACTPSEREQQLQATVDALSTRNAALEATTTPAIPTTVAPSVEADAPEVGGGAPAATVSATAPSATAPPPAPVRIATTAVENPIPREISRVEIVRDETHLADFRVDADAGVAYLTDSDYTLHIVDLASTQEVGALAVSGDRLLLDAPNQRLYIMPDAPYARTGVSPTVTVFDMAGREVVAELPGSRVGVDEAGNRLYIGDDVSFYSHNEPGVRLYDAETLQLVRTGSMAGNPVYNAVADELIIQNSSAWTADPNTLEVRNDLYPQITGIDLPGCNGCPAAADAFFFPEQSVVAVQTTILSPQGAGRIVPTDLYAAATMERLPQSTQMGATCSSQPQLRTPIAGHVVRVERYVRYMFYNNLYLQDIDANTLVARDGMWVSFVNPETGVGYLQTSSTTGYVLDLGTLAPAGMTDSLCYFARDEESGRLYATDAQRHALVVMEPTGGDSKLPPPQPFALDDQYIVSILPSPHYAQDQTLYLVVWLTDGSGGQALLRSSDGGQTYTRLGGLPVGEDLELTLAISPDFANDKTLFAGGARRDFAGEGVWKSTDGGDTWVPVWDGLAHLRVNRIDVSPRYDNDQAVLAWASYYQIAPSESGYSLQRSTDGGLNWTRVITAESQDLLPAPSVYLPITVTADLPVRKEYWFEPIQIRIDSTHWTSATADLGKDEAARTVLQAPAGSVMPDLFVVTEVGLYRTQDDGRTWARWTDARLAALTGEDGISAAAVTPLLAGGGYRLLLGTAYGAIWEIEPDATTWEAVIAAPLPTPEAAQAAATATATLSAQTVATPTASAAAPPEQEPPVAQTATLTPVIAPLVGEPPAGLFRPGGIFGPTWQADGALQQAMGFARSEQPNSVAAAYQYFQNGAMIWRGDEQKIYVIYDDGTWEVYDDTFKEGEAESDPSLKAPSGLMQPVRGFGKVWRASAGVREHLGWAVGKEAGINALVQEFERGTYVRAESVEAALYEAPTGKEWKR